MRSIQSNLAIMTILLASIAVPPDASAQFLGAPGKVGSNSPAPKEEESDEDVVDETEPQKSDTDKSEKAVTSKKRQPQLKRRISQEVAPLLKRAYDLMLEHQFRSAIVILREALKADAYGITAQRYMAFCLAKGGLPKDALNALSRLIKQIEPTYFEWCTFGEVYLQSGSLDHAQKCYEEALKLTPDNHYAKSGLIRILIEREQFDKAMEDSIEAMKVSKNIEIYNYYKALYMRAQERKQFKEESLAAPAVEEQQDFNSDPNEVPPV